LEDCRAGVAKSVICRASIRVIGEVQGPMSAVRMQTSVVRELTSNVLV
jgi:phage FluMu protein gp41